MVFLLFGKHRDKIMFKQDAGRLLKKAPVPHQTEGTMKQTILNTKLAEGQLAFFYLGQEGFIVKACDQYILIDGYLTGKMAEPGFAWGRS